MTDLMLPAEPVIGATAVDPSAATALHQDKQRRLLCAIELTLFGLVLAIMGSGQIGFIVAILGVLISFTGL